jgi:SAM-dependent methyltransferase
VAASVLARYFKDAEVVAVDTSEPLLAMAAARAAAEGVGDRVRTHVADLAEGLAGVGPADLIWTSKAVHHVGDQQGALSALVAALRPGGVLGVAEGGLAPRYLPRDLGSGRPGFGPRLEAAREEWFSDMRAALPGHERVLEDWPGLLAGAGAAPAGSLSVLTDHPAPLALPVREHLHERLAMVREQAAEQLSPEDRETLDTLLADAAPTSILLRPDAFYLAVSTVHAGRAPRED